MRQQHSRSVAGQYQWLWLTVGEKSMELGFIIGVNVYCMYSFIPQALAWHSGIV